jgi:hypothetical protein
LSCEVSLHVSVGRKESVKRSMNTNPKEVSAVPGINRKKSIGGCNIQITPDLYSAQDVINETLPSLFPVWRRNGGITNYSNVLEDLMTHNEIKIGRGEWETVVEAPDFSISVFADRPN